MSRRPSFQFYPADWLANPGLKRCSHAEKGMWMDILCLLHDSPEYGVSRWPLPEIASSIGATFNAVQGLVRKGVLKGSDTHCEAFVFTPRSGRQNGDPVILVPEQDGPVWFSSRMVTDEYKAQARSGITKPGHEFAPKVTPNPSPKGGIGEGFGAHPSRARPSPSSSASVKEKGDASASPKKPADPKGCRIPDDFGVSLEMAAWARENAQASTDMVRRETEKFIDYWRAKPGAEGRKSDWPGTWRNWIRRAMENGHDRSRGVGSRDADGYGGGPTFT